MSAFKLGTSGQPISIVPEVRKFALKQMQEHKSREVRNKKPTDQTKGFLLLRKADF